MKTFFTALCLTGMASLAQADWALDRADSNFSFASIKKNHVYETHTFKRYEGSINDSGAAVLMFDLNSVSTGIGIRDQRMQSMLFDTNKFSTAQYHLKVNPASLEALKAGQRMQMNVAGSLSLFGTEKQLPAVLDVFKLTNNRLLVTTAKPIVLKAADYGLDSGVEALRKIAGLPVISTSVPVNFSLVFDMQ